MNRRGFLGALTAAPVAAWAGTHLLRAPQYPGQPVNRQPGLPGQSGQTAPNQPPGQLPAPQFPGQPSPSQSPDDFPEPKIDPKLVLKDDQKQMVKTVDRIYDLAGKLRKQVSKTDSSEVLSMDVIHTAGEIEKLARHVKDLARG